MHVRLFGTDLSGMFHIKDVYIGSTKEKEKNY